MYYIPGVYAEGAAAAAGGPGLSSCLLRFFCLKEKYRYFNKYLKLWPIVRTRV